MKRANKELEEIKKKVIPILKREKIKKAGIFGSYATGEQNADSDVDILVEFDGSLIALAGLELELEKILRKKVDLLTYRGIYHLLRERILQEEIQIL